MPSVSRATKMLRMLDRSVRPAIQTVSSRGDVVRSGLLITAFWIEKSRRQ
jgi:hypothetical protein